MRKPEIGDTVLCNYGSQGIFPGIVNYVGTEGDNGWDISVAIMTRGSVLDSKNGFLYKTQEIAESQIFDAGYYAFWPKKDSLRDLVDALTGVLLDFK